MAPIVNCVLQQRALCVLQISSQVPWTPLALVISPVGLVCCTDYCLQRAPGPARHVWVLYAQVVLPASSCKLVSAWSHVELVIKQVLMAQLAKVLFY